MFKREQTAERNAVKKYNCSRRTCLFQEDFYTRDFERLSGLSRLSSLSFLRNLQTKNDDGGRSVLEKGMPVQYMKITCRMECLILYST